MKTITKHLIFPGSGATVVTFFNARILNATVENSQVALSVLEETSNIGFETHALYFYQPGQIVDHVGAPTYFGFLQMPSGVGYHLFIGQAAIK